MSDEPQEVRYALAHSVVKIDGTVTFSTAANGERVPSRTVDVTLGVEADRDADNSYTLKLDSHWWSTREFELKLAPDGRLAGASDSTTGLGGKVIAAGLKVGALALKLGSVIFLQVPADVAEPVSVEETLKAELPDLAARRERCSALIASLETRLFELGEKLASEDPGEGTADLAKAVEETLAAARAEMAVLDARFTEWRAERFPTTTTAYSYAVGVGLLPGREQATETIVLTEEDLQGHQVPEVAHTLGVVVVRIGDTDSPHTPQNYPDSGVRYRLPRRCALAVYELPEKADESWIEGPGNALIRPGAVLELRRVMPAWIVDGRSEEAFVPFMSGAFSKHGAGAVFGDSGTLTSVTNKQTGAGDALAAAAGGAGAAITGGFDEAGKIAAAFPDPETRALTAEVARKELEAKLATAKKTIAEAANEAKYTDLTPK